MIRNGKLLWIWRKDNDIWEPTTLIGQSHYKQEEAVKSDSMMPKQEEITQSTEHTDPEIVGM